MIYSHKSPCTYPFIKAKRKLNILLIWWPRNPSTGQNLKQYPTGFILVHSTQGTDAMFVDSFTQWKKAINPANKKRPPRCSSNFSAPLESERARTARRHILWSNNFKLVWLMRRRYRRDSLSSPASILVGLLSGFYFGVERFKVLYIKSCISFKKYFWNLPSFLCGHA